MVSAMATASSASPARRRRRAHTRGARPHRITPPPPPTRRTCPRSPSRSSAARAAPPRRAAAAAAAKPRGASAVVKPLGGARRSAVATRAKDDFAPGDGPGAERPHRHLPRGRAVRREGAGAAGVLLRVRARARARHRRGALAAEAGGHPRRSRRCPPCQRRGERDSSRSSWTSFSPADAAEVKKVERTTNHDVKAVEYVIKDRLAAAPGARTA